MGLLPIDAMARWLHPRRCRNSITVRHRRRGFSSVRLPYRCAAAERLLQFELDETPAQLERAQFGVRVGLVLSSPRLELGSIELDTKIQERHG